MERALVRPQPKPWGSTDLRPWSRASTSEGRIGELWFERPGLASGPASSKTALLLKLLFTTEPLSIQVHPDDTFARSIGLANGKSEAWYILSAAPDARVGVGLKHKVTREQLRASIRNGSVTELMDL